MLNDILSEVVKKSCRDAMQTLATDNRCCWLYLKQTKWDTKNNDKELFKVRMDAGSWILRPTNEDKGNFTINGSSNSVLSLHQDRMRAVGIRLSLFNKYYKKIKDNTLRDKDKEVLGKYFAGISIRSRIKTTFYNFVDGSTLEMHNNEIKTSDGFYYNERFDKDKYLIFFKEEFINTWTEKCYDCGGYHIIAYDTPKYTKVEGWGDSVFCDTCLERRNYGKCDISGKMGFRTLLKFSCKQDEKAVRKVLKIKTGEINAIVNYLREKKISLCDDCGCAYVSNGSAYSYYCSDCKLSQVLDYGTKNYKTMICKSENDVKELFGFELETETRRNYRDCVKLVNKGLRDLVVLKRDGSLGDYGFEIVSQTLSYKKYMSERDKFDKVFKQAVKTGCYSKNAETTGLHIHLAREGFKDASHLARFCQIWYKYKDFTRYIAKRDFGDYRRWNEVLAQDGWFKNFIGNDLWKRYYNHSDRYNFINLYCDKTVEVRIFKGIMSEKYLSLCIEICKLIKDYTENDCNLMNMLDYLIKRGTIRLKNFVKSYKLQQNLGLEEAI